MAWACSQPFVEMTLLKFRTTTLSQSQKNFGRRGAVITRLGAIPEALEHTCDRGAKSIADSIEATRCGPYGQKTGGATAAAAGGGGVRVGAEQEEQ